MRYEDIEQAARLRLRLIEIEYVLARLPDEPGVSLRWERGADHVRCTVHVEDFRTFLIGQGRHHTGQLRALGVTMPGEEKPEP